MELDEGISSVTPKPSFKIIQLRKKKQVLCFGRDV